MTKAERPDQPSALLRALRRLFRRDVLKLSETLRRQGALRVTTMPAPAPTTWSRYEDPRPLRQRFEFAPEWDTPRPDPEKVADAITRDWAPGPATEALRPLLARLLALGLHYPPEEALEEKVSESVYVMF